jgi:GNAT superfamily N-acetyltransferase
VNNVTVVDARPLMPGGIQFLLEASRTEGIDNLSKLVRQWIDGTVLFDGAGESLLMAQIDGANVGVGGLLHCKDVEGALRVSRFYVLPAWRRQGVATILATEVLRMSERFADRVTCNARASGFASQFWESLGFLPVPRVGVTHIRSQAKSTASL